MPQLITPIDAWLRYDADHFRGKPIPRNFDRPFRCGADHIDRENRISNGTG